MTDDRFSSDHWEALGAALSDRYTIERELGRGGMATVYLARDIKHDRNVAIKVLHPELAAVIGADRFVREIQTIANLQHPHILGLIDSGTIDGTAYYVMPFIDGESLRNRLSREKQLPIADAVRISSEVADALQYAHSHGVIHRDIKPENILLQGGHALVADFGIALAAGSAGARMTETGMSLGTPQYMSPEQAMGERDLGARSDIYALGCVTYEMLAGEPPFSGPTAQTIVARVMTEVPRRLVAQRRSVPSNVDAAVLAALEKLPADRFATMHAFAEALANTSFVGDASGAVPVRMTHPRTAPLALGVAVVAMLAVLWAWRSRSAPDVPTTRQWIGLSQRTPDGSLPLAWPLTLAIAPNDGAIVFADTAIDGRTAGLFIKENAAATAVPLAGTVGGSNPFWSPDGKWIGFATTQGLYKVPRSGGSGVLLSDSATNVGAAEFGSGAWLDDGTIVFPGRDDGHLLRVNAAGGTTELVTPVGAITAGGVVRLDPLPDSRGVIVTVCAAAPCVHTEVWLIDMKRHALAKLTTDASAAWYVPGDWILLGHSNGSLSIQRLDIARRRLTGVPVTVLTEAGRTAGIPNVAFGRDGTLLFANGQDQFTGVAHRLAQVDRDGVARTIDSSLSIAPFPGGGLRLSPDGKRLALVLATDAGSQIFIRQLSDGATSQLTFTGQNWRPEWSPDGRDLVFIHAIAGEPESVWRQHADGSGVPREIFHEARSIAEAILSPDSTWLVYRTDNVAAGAGDILAHHLVGDTATRPLIATAASEFSPALSPDGRWLAYTSSESGRPEIIVRPFPDVTNGKWQVSRGGGVEPAWSSDGRELFYRSNETGNQLIANPLIAADVDGTGAAFRVTSQRQLFSTAPYATDVADALYAPAVDGKSFYFEQLDAINESAAQRLTLVRHWFTELRPLLAGAGKQ